MSASTQQSSGVRQWLRKISLIAAPGAGQKGIELSELRVRFTVVSRVTTSPATLLARIYNLAPPTAKRLAGLKTIPHGEGVNPTNDPTVAQVVLRAGYEGNYGIIFRGDLMQVKEGRESGTDTYVDLFAADGDWGHTWGFVNQSLAAGYTHADIVNQLRSAYGTYGVNVDDLPTEVPLKQAPRGKVLFGMARDYVREIQSTLEVDAYTHQSTLQWLPQSAYKPGEAVKLNSRTGMLDFPQQTGFGLTVHMLLNPSVGPGIRLQINNAEVQKAQFIAATNQTNVNQYFAGSVPKGASDADGFYKVLGVSHFGDTRGNEWYTEAVCQTLNPVGQIAVWETTDYVGYPVLG